MASIASFKNRGNIAGSVQPVKVIPEKTPLVDTTNETDEEIAQKLAIRFDILEKMTYAVVNGVARSLIVSGPAGLGKSFTIEEIMAEQENSRTVKGFVRATALYKTLYQNRHPGSIVVFDDADSVFNDVNSLNIIKAATDTTERRVLTWGAETTMTTEEGEPLPTSFQFDGGIIFITNFDFEAGINKGSKLSPHFEAMMSRAHYIDLEMKSKRDYLVRIKQVIAKGMLRSERGIDEAGEIAISNFIDQHYLSLRELSLRMALKIADLYKMDPSSWEDMAKVTLFKRRR